MNVRVEVVPGEIVVESLSVVGEPSEQLIRINGDLRSKYAEVSCTGSAAEDAGRGGGGR